MAGPGHASGNHRRSLTRTQSPRLSPRADAEASKFCHDAAGNFRAGPRGPLGRKRFVRQCHSLPAAHCHLQPRRSTLPAADLFLHLPDERPDLNSDPEIPNSRSPDSRLGFGRETGKGIPDSRLGRNRESGTPVSRFGRGRESGSQLAANRKIGDAPLCEYSSRDPGLNVALSP